jgi:single-strand DNA-binding protein
MNSFNCEGRIVAPAELRETNGTSLSSFRLASNVGFGDRQTTLWIDCTIWGKRAETLNPMLPKGQQVFVNGELSLRTYPKKDGTEGSSLSLRVNDLSFGKGAGGEANGGNNGGVGQTNNQSQEPLDDDIPF